MKLACGGKVFIVGEYACIEGGPALVGTLGPLFVLNVETGHESVAPFAAGSPAGIYLERNANTLKGMRLLWNDPYSTAIGVGSSSAQFLLAVAAVAKLRGEALPTARELLELYWETVGATQGLRPSGVDVVAQWLGGPLVARNEPFATETLPDWPVGSTTDADFILAFTGTKARTHEHLKALRERGFPTSHRAAMNELSDITTGAIHAWKTNDAKTLGESLNSYQAALTRAGLAPTEFTTQLEPLQRRPGVLGCKGSGAQGGDCVLLLVRKSHLTELTEELKRRSWEPIAIDWTSRGVHELV